MKNKNLKALLYNFLGFASFYIPAYFIAQYFFPKNSMLIPLVSFIFALLLAPKFQYALVENQPKIFMRWVFSKGVKDVT